MSRSINSGRSELPTRGRATRLLVLIASAAVAGLCCSAAAQADLPVSHVSYTLSEGPGPNDGDGIVGPGDAFSLTEKVQSAYTTSTLTNVVGALQAGPSAPVSVTQGSSPYPDLQFGVTTGNTNPFQAALSSGLDNCGVVVPFTLQLTTTQGSATVPFSVQTGAQGAFNAYSSTQVPLTIPSPGQVVSSFNVATAGRVKHVRVQIGSLTHNYDGDLQLELIAPNGADVHLFEPSLSNNGQNFVNTTFDDSAGTAIASGSAPYTGGFRPAQPLSAFVGLQQQGTWQLKITDNSPGDHGSLNSWGASVAPAVCTTQPMSSFTATPNPVLTGGTVGFDGSGSTTPSPGATIVDYKWDFNVQGGVPNFATDTGSTPTTSHVYGARGNYTVALQVTDSNQKTSTATLPLSVTQAPVAAIVPTPSAPVSGQAVTFDASSSTHDPAGSIKDYKWDLDGSGNYATDTGQTPTVTTSYPTQHSVPIAVSVRVTDDVGATSVATTNITVGNAPPVASFAAPAPILLNQPVTFDGSSSHDIDGTVVDYRWDLDGSGAYATDTGTTPTVSRSYASPGAVTVGLRVTDNNGATTTTTRVIQVTRPPVAHLSATPSSPVAGQTVTLDAGGSTDPDGAITAYRWDLDGSGQFATSTGQVSFLQHTFTAGTFPIRVRVTDSYGATATASLSLTVSAPAGAGAGSALLAQVGPTLGGSPAAGIAALTGGDLESIAAGSNNHFAAITGAPVRTAASVARSGLWVNVISDRSAQFTLTVSVAAADARRLHIARARHGKRPAGAGLKQVAAVSTSLSGAGQRPFDIALPAGVRSKLSKLRGRLQLIVTGSAVDANGNRSLLSRAFEVRR